MVKKIKKYLKFVVCCVLIMSLVAPSYAALGASDGSAFVTKSEFDSALADFNARLTTFEAGINSKIDSQVTSYLDRNGIWNGKTQTLALPPHPVSGVPFFLFRSDPNFTAKDPIPGDQVMIGYDYSNKTFTKGIQGQGNVNTISYEKAIDNVSKSGLLFFSGRIRHGINDSSNARALWTFACLQNYVETPTDISNSKQVYWGFEFSQDEDFASVLSSVSCGDLVVGWQEATATKNATTGVYTITMKNRPFVSATLQPGTKVAVFFVDKNKPLYIREIVQANVANQNNSLLLVKYTRWDSPSVWVDVCKVY